MAGFKDYYKILGVEKKAGDKEIKQAYRKLARKYRPDVNPGDKSAEDRFKEVSEAYEVLSDKEKRAKYDNFGEQWQHAQRAGAPGPGGQSYPGYGPGGQDLNFDMGGFDLFETLFGERGRGGRRGATSMKGDDLRSRSKYRSRRRSTGGRGPSP